MHLLIMGAPGSGKGTCAVELKKYYSIPHISTGDIFRKAIGERTSMGLLAKSYIDDGHLVPDNITINIVKERLSEEDCKKGFILDGFPRTMEQAEALSKILIELNLELDAVINLEIEDEVVVERIVNRRLCKNCGKGYNLISIKPMVDGLCDDCKTPLYQRDDDTEETIRERLAVYKKETQPISTYYEKLGILLSVNSNQSISDVVEEIISKVNTK